MSKKVDEYIINNGLEISYIPKEFLYQVRPTLPETKFVASTSDFIVMFEETQGSLRNRHYKYKEEKKPTFNLVYVDKKSNARLFTYDDIEKIENIKLLNNYTVIDIERFLNTDNIRKKGKGYNKTGRKSVLFYITEDEKIIMKQFLERLRNSKKI